MAWLGCRATSCLDDLGSHACGGTYRMYVSHASARRLGPPPAHTWGLTHLESPLEEALPSEAGTHVTRAWQSRAAASRFEERRRNCKESAGGFAGKANGRFWVSWVVRAPEGVGTCHDVCHAQQCSAAQCSAAGTGTGIQGGLGLQWHCAVYAVVADGCNCRDQPQCRNALNARARVCTQQSHTCAHAHTCTGTHIHAERCTSTSFVLQRPGAQHATQPAVHGDSS